MQSKLFPLASVLLALGLSGCQLTENESENVAVEQNEKAALEACAETYLGEEDIADCEVARDGVIDVIHPKDDVLEETAEVTAPEDAEVAAVITDVWQRASNTFH
jgi:hypothetical protein